MATPLDDYLMRLSGAMQQANQAPAGIEIAPAPNLGAVQPQQAQPAQNSNFLRDFFQGLSSIVRRDPLGETARRNTQSNQTHSAEEWTSMFGTPEQRAARDPRNMYSPQQRADALRQTQSQFGNMLNIGGGRVVADNSPWQFGTPPPPVGSQTMINPRLPYSQRFQDANFSQVLPVPAPGPTADDYYNWLMGA